MLRDGDVDAALARERELWDAFKANDRARLEQLVDPLALDVGPWGVLSRDEMLAAVARMRIESYTIDDVRVRRVDGVAIVVYSASVSGAYNCAPFAFAQSRVSSIWHWSGETWRLVHRQESPRR